MVTLLAWDSTAQRQGPHLLDTSRPGRTWSTQAREGAATLEIERAVAATFAEHLHSSFRVHHDGAAIALDLVAVADSSTPRQVTFTLLFRGPARPVLAQQIYSFEHDRLGRFDLFIVPVGQDAQGLAYEAVFNRLVDEPARG